MLDLHLIGETITYYRENAEMTQQSLADRLYVTRQAISKWETGKSMPSIELMVEITKLFNITIDDLLYGQKKVEKDMAYLLKHHPRAYVIDQFIQDKIKVPIEEVLYLLSPEERELLISHIIKNNCCGDLESLFPYLNSVERRRILLAIKQGSFDGIITNVFLTNYERILLEV